LEVDIVVHSKPLLAGMFVTTVVAALMSVLPSAPPAASADRSPIGIPGRGASVPFVEQEAEDVANNGTVIGPDRTFTTLPAEASGRRAVRLDAVGEFVEFTLSQPANAMVVRYSVPDSASGTGLTAPVNVLVNGTVTRSLPFTSVYGWYYGSYPFTNSPGAGNPHHFYDEIRTMFGSTLAAGTRVRVQVSSTSIAPWFIVDLADFELVGAPKTRPANSESVTDHGADPTGAADASSAFEATIAAARAAGREVWIPQGTFRITRHIIVDQVTVRGAGPWYSVTAGDRIGWYGRDAGAGGSHNVTLADFAIMGEVKERNDGDQVNAIGGALSDTTVSNVWMQHNKVGAWMDGPMTNLHFIGCRILDQTADGLNFHRGVTNSSVEQTFVRNTGDDGLAMWAEIDQEIGNAFRFNTVVLPILANSIAVYGGQNIDVTDNVVADTLTQGGGIHVGQRFGSRPVSGTFTIARNTTIRAGVLDPNWQFGVGALWFDARDGAINATINVTDLDLLDSSYEAIHWVNGTVNTVNFNRVTIDGAGTFALQLQANGSASFSNTTARNIGFSNPIYSCLGGGAFTITQGSGNSGLFTQNPYCGPFPPPVYGPQPPPPPPPGSVQLSPTSLTFGTQNVGTTSAGQQVTVRNPGSTAVALQSISTSGDFGRTTTCGTSLAAGASCAVTVTFTPTAAGSRTGTLTVNSTSASLSGTGFDPSGNLAAGRPATATSTNAGFVAGNAVDGNAGSYWESANNAFPQSLTVDLGSSMSVSRVVVKLPPDPAWQTRTQTLAVLGSTDGGTFGTVVGATGYTFNPATGNTVTIPFTATSLRHLRLTVTANTGWPAAQVSELEVYASGGGQPPPPPNTNLAAGRPTTETSHTQNLVSGNVVDGNAGSYWESANNAFPQSVTVDLGSSVSVSRVVLKLPPASAWGSRTQTLTVLGSADGASFTTIVNSAGYTFNAATGNTVTITFGATSRRHLRVTITANTGWPAGQLSELEVYPSQS
jgi:hypothetical protein